MVRPRTLLLSYFSQSSFITQELASQTLRDCNGDVEEAKKYLEALDSRKERNDSTGIVINNAVTTTSKDKIREEKMSSIDTDTITSRKAPLTKNNMNVKGSEKADDHNERRPPNTVAVIHNLSDRQYCCVWAVEVYEDGYRPEVARTLLAQIAHHVNPILRARGWRVKRLMESASTKYLGCCTGNGRDDADAASTNIQLNLRVQPNKHCTVFRTFSQLLSVMLHEITHTSIGLEDIHP
jgi:WLM domain